MLIFRLLIVRGKGIFNEIMFACLILTISIFGCFIYSELIAIKTSISQLVDITAYQQLFPNPLKYISIFEILSLVILIVFPFILLIFLKKHP